MTPHLYYLSSRRRASITFSYVFTEWQGNSYHPPKNAISLSHFYGHVACDMSYEFIMLNVFESETRISFTSLTYLFIRSPTLFTCKIKILFLFCFQVIRHERIYLLND